MSSNTNAIDILDLFTVLDDKIQAAKATGWLETISLEHVEGSFKKEALELWASVMYKHEIQLLRYARAISIMKDNLSITEEDMKQAIEMIASGKDKEILKEE